MLVRSGEQGLYLGGGVTQGEKTSSVNTVEVDMKDSCTRAGGIFAGKLLR